MSTSLPAARNHRWMWFFAVLVFLAVSATATLIVYNLNQQLKPEEIAHAQQQWREHGPLNYRLLYKITVDRATRGEKDEVHYEVTVRGGVVTTAMKDDRAEPTDRLGRYGMDRLLAFVADNMAKDQEPGRPRTFTRAMFAPNNGALLWYVRRVMGSHERVEITMERIE